MSKALENQVGGNHYKKYKMQPVELYASIGCNYFQASVIKYILRYKDKNGLEDLNKIIHIAELAKDLNPKNKLGIKDLEELTYFYGVNKLSPNVTQIVDCAAWQKWDAVIGETNKIIKEEYNL